MAGLRSSLPLLIGAVLVFGLLTFLFGLVVGANLVAVPEASPAAKPPLAAPHVVAPPLPAFPSPTLAPTSPAVPAPAAPAPAPAVTPAPAPPPAAPGANSPAPSGEAAPAVKPVKVKGFGFGEPPSALPSSGLRGPLLEQAANPPPLAPLAPADSGQAAAPPPPAALPVKDPAPPMVYSVAVGRFLMESRAGALSSAVAAKGFTPVVVVADPPDGTGWLTVTLGPQEDATQAKRLAKEAESQGFDTWMVSWLPP